MGKCAIQRISLAVKLPVAHGFVSLQLIAVVGGQDGQREESGISGSLDIMTTTSNLSDEVSGEVTAEGMREMWRRAHGRPRSTEVNRQAMTDSTRDRPH